MATHVERLPLVARIPDIHTPMLGRERDARALLDLLADNRLVTLTGPGGVGKSRLAIHLAATLREAFNDAVVFVPLASVRDPKLILPQIGQAVGFAGDPFGAYEDGLVSHLQGQRALIVLDNLEQLPEAFSTLGRLHEALPDVTLLATSRVELSLHGEAVYPLAPFPVHTDREPEDLLASEAVTLFVARARASAPWLGVDDDTVRTIASICGRLDGLPLAIELAAARMNVMSPQRLLARMDESFGVVGAERPELDARHRTIRKTIAWSYDLLPAEAQRLLRQLALFEGGFAGDVPAFLGADPETMNTLCKHHLVADAGDGRYVMLESVRDFARHNMEQLGETTGFREMHASYIVRLVESADLNGPDQLAWGARFDAELVNIRAAIGWAIASGRRDLVLRSMGSICPYLSSRMYWTEARAWLLEALKDTSADLYTARINALIDAGLLWTDSNDYDQGLTFYSQARQLAIAVGDRALEGKALSRMGAAWTDQGDFDQAIACLQDAASVVDEAEHPRAYASILSNTGKLLFYTKRPLEAIDHFERSSRIHLSLGDEADAVQEGINIGIILADMGRYADAETYLEEGIAWHRGAGDKRVFMYALGPLAQGYLIRGRLDEAERLFQELHDLHHDGGIAKWQAEGLIGLSCVARERGDPDSSARFILEALELVADGEEHHYVIAPEEEGAMLLLTAGDVVNAARIFGVIRKAVAESEEGNSHFNQTLQSRIEEGVRAALSPDEAEALMSEGEKMPEAVVYRELQRMVRHVIGRQHPDVAPVVPDDMLQDASAGTDFGLTPRELETIRHLVTGKSTREVAEAMGVSARTVATHVSHILAKMEVTSRTAAVARAMQLGLIPLDERR